MIDIADIQDEDTLRAWLEEQGSYELSVTIAARAALRVQPLNWERHAPVWHPATYSAIPFVRDLLIASCATLGPSPLISKAAVAASSLQIAAGDPVGHARLSNAGSAVAAAAAEATNLATESASEAVAAAAATLSFAINASGGDVDLAGGDAYSLIRKDCHVMHRANAWAHPLWHRQTIAFDDPWPNIAKAWRTAGAPWDTFADWYDKVLAGTLTPADWAFYEQIALIEPHDTWDGEDAPAKIAARIAEFRKRNEVVDAAIEASPNAERVVVDPDTGKLTTLAVDDLGAAFRAEIVEELETAMRRFLETCADDRTSDLGKVMARVAERDLRYLQEDLRNPRYGDRAFYDKIEACHATLTERFRQEGAETDPDAMRLLNALDTATLTIVASSDEVRDIVHRRTEEIFRRLDAEQLLVLKDMLFGMAEDALPDLAEDLRRKWKTAQDPEATETEKRQAQYTIGSRIPRGARAINYSRFQGGYRVVPERQDQPADKLWWATVLAPSGAVLISRLLSG